MEHAEVELNEKLAKWAGVLISIESWPDEEPTMYVYDTEQENLIGECSPFTESLDACFKWLVPKCGSVWIETGSGEEGPFHSVHIYAEKESTWTYNTGGPNAALALCRAIEKMIDSAHPA